MMVACRVQNLVDQSGLADSRPPRDEHARSSRVRDRAGNESLFLGSPDHRPPVHGLIVTQPIADERKSQYLVLRVHSPLSGTLS